MLRAQNVPPGAEARRQVTDLRDGAGAVLALMRQTKMDEATIRCDHPRVATLSRPFA